MALLLSRKMTVLHVWIQITGKEVTAKVLRVTPVLDFEGLLSDVTFFIFNPMLTKARFLFKRQSYTISSLSYK